MNRTLIKFCGMTNIDDVKFASDTDIDFIGLIFAKESPRCLNLNQAEKIINACNNRKPTVGVFMNQTKDFINNITNNISVDFLQFHGNESEEFCKSFNKKYFKTISINNNTTNYDIEHKNSASAFIIDNSKDSSSSGIGKTFDWSILENNTNLMKLMDNNYFIAGGLNPDNIKNLIIKYQPKGLDVSSGIEHSIGKKDFNLMKKFIENVRIPDKESYEKNKL